MMSTTWKWFLSSKKTLENKDYGSVTKAAQKVLIFFLQQLHNAYWSCKDNKSHIIDCSTVLECFRKHQSRLQRIKGTAPSAYDAEQTEMDSQQTNYIVVLAAGKVNSTTGFINFMFKWTFQLLKSSHQIY